MLESKDSTLFVEGDDDMHSIEHLLHKRGMMKEEEWFPEVKPVRSVDGLLGTVVDAVRAGTGNVVGFVLDANGSATDRWQDITRKLEKTGMTPPHMAPDAGYVDYCDSYRTRVGVWLMPDNRNTGAIEEFLLALIDPKDPLLGHAESATDEARNLGASFPQFAWSKARLRAWLAWQESPGFPYGRAIGANYFDNSQATADPFVNWFIRLYNPPAG